MLADQNPLQELDPLDAAADHLIAACEGDVRAAVQRADLFGIAVCISKTKRANGST